MNIFTLDANQIVDVIELVAELDKEVVAQVSEVVNSGDPISLTGLEDNLRKLIPHSFDPQMTYICRVFIRRCLLDYMILLKSPKLLENE